VIGSGGSLSRRGASCFELSSRSAVLPCSPCSLPHSYRSLCSRPTSREPVERPTSFNFSSSASLITQRFPRLGDTTTASGRRWNDGTGAGRTGEGCNEPCELFSRRFRRSRRFEAVFFTDSTRTRGRDNAECGRRRRRSRRSLHLVDVALLQPNGHRNVDLLSLSEATLVFPLSLRYLHLFSLDSTV
jgi:hypothetical protein